MATSRAPSPREPPRYVEKTTGPSEPWPPSCTGSFVARWQPATTSTASRTTTSHDVASPTQTACEDVDRGFAVRECFKAWPSHSERTSVEGADRARGQSIVARKGYLSVLFADWTADWRHPDNTSG